MELGQKRKKDQWKKGWDAGSQVIAFEIMQATIKDLTLRRSDSLDRAERRA
jgi:hypothetical protein